MVQTVRMLFAGFALLVSTGAWSAGYVCKGPDGSKSIQDTPCAKREDQIGTARTRESMGYGQSTENDISYTCEGPNGARRVQFAKCSPSETEVLRSVPASMKFGCFYMDDNERREQLIGSPAKKVIKLCGEPSDINNTASKYGLRQQFVYRERRSHEAVYIYIEGGVVTGVQD